LDIFELLPHTWVNIADLPKLIEDKSNQPLVHAVSRVVFHFVRPADYDHRTLYAVRATTSEIVARIDGTPGPVSVCVMTHTHVSIDMLCYIVWQVDKQHYYAHPEMYRSTFAERVAPYTTVLVNCLYWDQR
jgi:hypothetical protein